jgi:hypothetical protein
MWYGKGKTHCTRTSVFGRLHGLEPGWGWQWRVGSSRLDKKNMTPEKIVQWKIISTLIGVLGTHGVQGFKMWPIILKIVEIVTTKLKNRQFLEFKFENLKKLKKIM